MALAVFPEGCICSVGFAACTSILLLSQVPIMSKMELKLYVYIQFSSVLRYRKVQMKGKIKHAEKEVLEEKCEKLPVKEVLGFLVGFFCLHLCYKLVATRWHSSMGLSIPKVVQFHLSVEIVKFCYSFLICSIVLSTT